MSKKVPELRFKGFTDDWEERKFADFIDVKSGKDYKHLNSGSIPVYGTGGYMLSVDRALSDIDAIGIGRKGTIDKPYLLKAPFWTVDTLFYAVPKQNIDLQFSLSIFKKINWKKFDESTGVPSLSKTVINSVGASVPSYEEQQKIGSFFQQLDETIALHQRKLDLLKEQKKGYLQKMFPKNGSKIPELRFAGFADDWEVRKLNEVSDIYDGTHQTPKYQDNGVMFLSVENIKTLTSNKFISREAFEDEFKIRPQRGDVLMTRIGDIGTANVVETDEDLAYYVSLALFKSEELNPYFLQASIYAPFVQDQIWKRTLHIAFPKKINKNEIGQVPINVPTLAEQTKIGSFFKQLDKTIALHQRKLDLLKEQKKGFLQKMFV
ncbi:restriction endonuclease subunit S [Streptococcus thermophilus]|nr:restriction endonuclease subunit S [Streptococcus thermophilus]MBW7818378.1 restriction endonuclease subunit S [Streptococcus thermophilus]MCE2168512.1 restriction endonuclease subunit S [Streptococcus thermophilus]MCE2175339.1 restriction endonuclease subunit S [Streptococcus thermophilus]